MQQTGSESFGAIAAVSFTTLTLEVKHVTNTRTALGSNAMVMDPELESPEPGTRTTEAFMSTA